jgi:hypothetical protein
MQGRLSSNAQNAANLFLSRAFSDKRHKRSLPFVVLSFCPITKTFANGTARNFRRSLIVNLLKAETASCLDDRLAPCRPGPKFLKNR